MFEMDKASGFKFLFWFQISFPMLEEPLSFLYLILYKLIVQPSNNRKMQLNRKKIPDGCLFSKHNSYKKNTC